MIVGWHTGCLLARMSDATILEGAVMRSRAVLCVAAVVAAMGLAACASSTAPGGISVGGHWNVTVSNLSGAGHVCNGSFVTNFTQSLGTFNGQYAGSNITCTTNGTSTAIGASSGTVSDGKVSGQTISYSLDNNPIDFTGTVNQTQMSGAVSWSKDFGDGNGPVTLSGSWTAQKQ
jgi:hypothetical protein